MEQAVAIVRDRRVERVEGATQLMNACSLVKQVVAHACLAVIDDLDERVHGDITVRHVLSHTTGLPNWRPQWRIDDELAWGAGWGLELGPPVCGWQWGLNVDASSFAIGCPETGDGVVVLVGDADGRPRYRAVVERELPGDHASLRVDDNATWLELFA